MKAKSTPEYCPKKQNVRDHGGECFDQLANRLDHLEKRLDKLDDHRE
jgi:hypothetical protein